MEYIKTNLCGRAENVKKLQRSPEFSRILLQSSNSNRFYHCLFFWKATHRCSECAANLCLDCYEMHGQQRSHEMLSLQEARRRGITKVRRQIMCPNHPERELTAFCTSCSQVCSFKSLNSQDLDTANSLI